MVKNNTEIWDQARGNIRSRKGGWRVGEGVFCHGYNMMDDFVGHVSYMQVVLLNATGRFPEKRLADWFEAIHICLSWPDSRIWCNQIGALGGSMRTTVVAATSAGIMAGDSRAYGPKTLLQGMNFIRQSIKEKRNGLTAEEIVTNECSKHNGKPKIMGFARPLVKGDERIPAMERTSQHLGFDIGEHLALAYEIENVMLSKFDEKMNINAYISAFLLDQGFSPNEVYQTFSVLLSSGITACYIDTFERPPESFLPLRCDDIVYQGPPHRPVPERD